MNPAALKTNVGDLPAGGALIVNSDAFNANNLKKAGYDDEPARPTARSSSTPSSRSRSARSTRARSKAST